MILVVTAAEKAAECKAHLEGTLGERVELASSGRQATQALRSGEYSVVVADQVWLDLNPGSSDLLWKHAGLAMPVVVNFAISATERIVREVRSALLRREQERLQAARAAEAVLRSEINSAVTGILLSSQMALSEPGLPPATATRLKDVCKLANQIRDRLHTPA